MSAADLNAWGDTLRSVALVGLLVVVLLLIRANSKLAARVRDLEEGKTTVHLAGDLDGIRITVHPGPPTPAEEAAVAASTSPDRLAVFTPVPKEPRP